MKILVIARHGDYERDYPYPVSEFGKMQMAALGVALKPLINGGSAVILASSARRASGSAAALGEELNIVPTEHAVLWSDDSHDTDTDAVLELIEQNKEADVVILVTHLEYSYMLPRKFALETFGSTSRFPDDETDYAQAWVIDCDARKCTRLSAEVRWD